MTTSPKRSLNDDVQSYVTGGSLNDDLPSSSCGDDDDGRPYSHHHHPRKMVPKTIPEDWPAHSPLFAESGKTEALPSCFQTNYEDHTTPSFIQTRIFLLASAKSRECRDDVCSQERQQNNHHKDRNDCIDQLGKEITNIYLNVSNGNHDAFGCING